jgi:Ca-activated chloride channel family protein
MAVAAAWLLLALEGPALSGEPEAPENARVSIEPRVEVRGSAERTATNIHVDSNLVLIPVMVTDPLDRSVTGLEKDHFKLFEDKVEQIISHFGAEDVPISVGVVFDRSGSMAGPKLSSAREAVVQFLKSANPEDEFSLVTFSDRPDMVVKLTQQTEQVQNRLMLTQASGRTALLDAIYLAMHEMKRSRNTRKALLVISDGGDNSSRYSVREIKNLVREADVQIFAIGIVEPYGGRPQTAEELAGPALLNEIAGQTGGRLFEVQNVKDLSDIASKIGVALRNTYLLGYAPSNMHRDGKYHKVQVKLDQPKGAPRLRASWRTGYYAPNQ